MRRRLLSKKRIREIAGGYSLTHDVESVPLAEELLETRARIAKLDRAAEALVKALYLYGGYSVTSRGPAGCIMDALDIVAPDVASALRDGAEASDVYQERWSEESP
jgi:hypothetical protein